MTKFSRPLPGFRHVTLLWGESLQQFAARVMGDASRWVDIANINGLAHPYVAEQASERVAAYGSFLMVPAPVAIVQANTDPDAVFGVDVRLKNGRLAAENGVLTVLAGVPNYVQAINHRVTTEVGELLFHSNYGCRARALIGRGNNPTIGMLAASYVKAALKSDRRTAKVVRCEVRIEGDVARIDADVEPVAGRPVESLNWEV